MLHGDTRLRIAELGRELELAGLLDLTAGNISARLGDVVAITPSGIPYGAIDPSDVCVHALADGAAVDAERVPSSELALHRAVYRALPEVGAVVHTHSPYATAIATLREPIPAVHYVIARLRTASVPVVDYATYGTDELAANAFGALGTGARAALLANHGVIAMGDDLDDAATNARVVEILAATYWRARAIGQPHVLSDDEIGVVQERYQTYGQPPAG